ncbi:MAG: dicarboxylate/amino acid:cation symporter [Tannerellaceae bacterium]|nr:dicarboxylate/amino acid:cation symporter [Tannerellaceae bacterium]
MKRIFSNLTFRLVIGVVGGILLGAVASEEIITAVVPVKYILGQLIFFMVPLIILGFVAPSITQLKSNASRLLTVALFLAYGSSVGSAFFAMFLGYEILPRLDITSSVEGLRAIPALFFRLDIPPVMSVMSALVLSLFVGLAVVWVQSDLYSKLLADFQKIVLTMVNRFLLPILPFFIAANFCLLSYEGALNNQLPVFLTIIVIIIVSHFIWLGVLYGISGFYSGKNPWKVLKYYGPAYLTAVGTMSSAATLGVALKSAQKSPVLRKEIIDFSIPLFANIHLCGSILTETFFVMAVSQVLYGVLPSFSAMIIFVLLLGIFGIGAPGVPGGTVMASLGLVISVLGFDEAGTALLLSIFALQDSFGTACNITGDGALTLILSGYEEKKVINPD